MNEPTFEPIDKSTWGDGPWQTEPDRVEWEHAGLPCLAARGPEFSGHWCGYVAVPPGHPLHGQSYEMPEVSIHGGLTYASLCDGHVCHVPKPGDPADVWWFGFDCLHSGDFSPAMHARHLGDGYPFSSDPYDHATAVAAHSYLVDVYRTLDYVQAEANHLAEQLAAMALPGSAPAVREDGAAPIVPLRDG